MIKKKYKNKKINLSINSKKFYKIFKRKTK